MTALDTLHTWTMADNLTPAAPLQITGWLTAALVCSIALAVLCVALCVFLSRPRRNTPRAASKGAHSTDSDIAPWRERVNAVLERHTSGDIDDVQAFGDLASIARQFASQASGRDLHTSTLAELDSGTPGMSRRQGYDLLRQTIAALYPPEFADPLTHEQARNVTVEQAAGWVLALIERWRS